MNKQMSGFYLEYFQGLKRHITVNHGDNEFDDEDDPLSLQLCPCCGEPSDSAHTVSKVFF